jgi:hypothetical protein
MTTPARIPAPPIDQERPAGATAAVLPLPVAGPATRIVRGPGGALVVAVLAFFLSLAASIDFPRAAVGFKGDEATYYSLTYSIARDGDMAFKREDLVRVWEEFTAPEGIFLKRGSQLHAERRPGFPFVRIVRTPDPAADRLYFGKSFIYSLFAAPFVRVFGTAGFMVFHSLLLALCMAAGYTFLVARGSRPASAAAFAAVFIFASITPVYFFWLTPEFFNFTLVFIGTFLWAYKLVAAPIASGGRLQRFLLSASSDYAAAVVFGLVTFSKPTNIPAALPLFLLPLAQRRLWRTTLLGGCFAATVVALFLVNTAATGEPNYQGGDRKTFYSSTGFPFANSWETFENRGQRVATGSVPTEILLNRHTAIVIVWDLMYFLIGRYGGLVPYFFPGVLAVLLFLARRAARERWQWFVAAAVAAGALGLLAYMPYTYSGGGGPVGNRYFLSFYPLFLFLVPPLRSVTPALTALVIGALFTAKITLNPFYSSFHPGEHAKAGPLRALPIERSLLNDLPVSADPARSRLRLAGTPPSSFYFVDDGAYVPEKDFFWVKGGRRADVLVRGPAVDTPDRGTVSFHIRAMRVEITNANVANRVVVSTGWHRVSFSLAPNEERVVELAPGPGVPYKPALFPMGYVYAISVSTTAGITPFLNDPSSSDSRYLGARVRIVPLYQEQ